MTARSLLTRTFFTGATLAVACHFSPLVAQDTTRPVKRYSIEQFLKTTNYRGASFSPDHSRILVSNDSSGVFNAYAIDIASGQPTRLTDSETDSIFSVSYFPDDERFLYTSDQGGNELNHLFVRNPNGDVADLTPGDKLKAQFLSWSRDNQSFYVGTNERDEKYFDVYQYNVDSLERQLVFKNEDGYDFADVTSDGSLIALSKTGNRDDSDIYLYSVPTGEITHLTPHEGEINHIPATFSPDDKALYFTTDADSDFTYLVRQDLESGRREAVAKPEWDVSFAGFSKNGKYLVIGTNEDARTVIEVLETATMKPVPLPEIEDASIASFGISDDEAHVAMYVSGSRVPSDLYYLNLDSEESAEPVLLTHSLNTEINPDDLVAGERVRFKSFDGEEIPGILYQPHEASDVARVPGLVWVHGGPGGQSRVGYNGLIQYLVNNGYAVFAINNRGSAGYGKRFERLDNRNHGKNDLLDCVASKKMLVESGHVDPQRIGIIGGSYGGYMTLAALTFQPQEFAVGIDIFGISNWYRTVQSIPPWWESQRRALEKELGDFSDEDYFRSISPLFHSGQIVKPLMVLQGANDPRVLKVESDEIVEAVRSNGVPVEYLVFDDEGHGFQKKENQTRGYKAILEFCNKYLKQSQR
jgi:dipeptidyl aminopeptidase/acylaminoacyl peptidase